MWHAGAPAGDAPSLMRSRYTGYVFCNEAYLLDTWHPSTRPQRITFDPQQRWLGLKITNAKITGVATAEVEFIARYRMGGATATRLTSAAASFAMPIAGSMSMVTFWGDVPAWTETARLACEPGMPLFDPPLALGSCRIDQADSRVLAGTPRAINNASSSSRSFPAVSSPI